MVYCPVYFFLCCSKDNYTSIFKLKVFLQGHSDKVDLSIQNITPINFIFQIVINQYLNDYMKRISWPEGTIFL